MSTGGIKIILIGGSSHTGKTTLGRRLAGVFGWTHMSTDQLSRHPGRPWRADESPLPDDVIAYYTNAGGGDLFAEVHAHYLQNVWPIARELVLCRINNRFDPPLVLEGSAILPECISELPDDAVRSAWLIVANEVLTERVRAQSRIEQADAAGQLLIESFLSRSLRFNDYIKRAAPPAEQFDATDLDAVTDMLLARL